jgi:hypothetical protein
MLLKPLLIQSLLLKALVGVVKLEFKLFWLACAIVKSLSEFLVLTPELRISAHFES